MAKRPSVFNRRIGPPPIKVPLWFKILFGFSCLLSLACVALFGFLVYTAVHFILKHW